jgi:hypothetical protein
MVTYTSTDLAQILNRLEKNQTKINDQLQNIQLQLTSIYQLLRTMNKNISMGL